MRHAPLKLPSRLAYRAFHMAVAGTLACSSEATSAVDASTDHGSDVVDARQGDVQDASRADVIPRDGTLQDALVLKDVAPDALGDSPADSSSDACTLYCGSTGVGDAASCPGFICDLSACPLDAGCEPFV
jgi:hypothetical protein